ncbi:MAG: basic amino acid ABC transporter substrate-binding protein [Longilinea sp.]|nr:basic amino acid ABC transporter substrate-binding protein [Longilinea sp.]
MKRSIFVMLVVLLALSLLLTACQNPTPKTTVTEIPTVDAGYPVVSPQPMNAYPALGVKLVVATDATFPPFEIVDEQTKQLTGFDIELMRAVAAKAGFEVEFVNLPFDPMLAGVIDCQYDAAIAAITITDERKAQMSFSSPYINAGQIVVVAADSKITGRGDLTNKTVGAQLGTTGEIEARKIDGVTYKPYDTYDLAFLDLANGQIDAVIADYPTALGYIGQNPQIKTVGEVFTDESYGIAFCKNKTEYIGIINQALEELKKDGTIAKLEQTWLAGK